MKFYQLSLLEKKEKEKKNYNFFVEIYLLFVRKFSLSLGIFKVEMNKNRR